MAEKSYLNLIHSIQANLNAADKCGEDGDYEGAKVLSDVAYGIWDDIACDLDAGVKIRTDGWSLESSNLLDQIIERLGEDD